MEQYEAYQPPKKKGFYLDPRTKVLFMAFITTLMFFVYENLAMDAAVAIIPLTLLLINRQVRTALIYGGLFALAVVAKLTQGMYVLPSVLMCLQLYKSLLFLKRSIDRDLIVSAQREALQTLRCIISNLEYRFYKAYGMEIEDKRTVYGECTYRLVPREDEPSVCLMHDWIYLPSA